MTDKSLLSRLSEYDRVAMHMPGHKRRKDLLCSGLPYHLDITEVSGFDNLHDMRGILKETAEMAAELYGSKYAFPLINGSTCGILAAIMAFCPFGSHALLARNCHKSVYNAISLFGITPHYLTPETDKLGVCGKISPKAVKNALENNSEISMVVIASPRRRSKRYSFNCIRVQKTRCISSYRFRSRCTFGIFFGISRFSCKFRC